MIGNLEVVQIRPTKYFFVEQDFVMEGKNPLDNIKISWDYLNNAPFV